MGVHHLPALQEAEAHRLLDLVAGEAVAAGQGGGVAPKPSLQDAPCGLGHPGVGILRRALQSPPWGLAFLGQDQAHLGVRVGQDSPQEGGILEGPLSSRRLSGNLGVVVSGARSLLASSRTSGWGSSRAAWTIHRLAWGWRRRERRASRLPSLRRRLTVWSPGSGGGLGTRGPFMPQEYRLPAFSGLEGTLVRGVPQGVAPLGSSPQVGNNVPLGEEV